MNDDIFSLEQAAMERWRNGDPMGFVELSAEDVVYVDPSLTAPIIGLDAYKAYMEPIVGKIHYQGSEFLDPRVVSCGDAALLTYNYRSSERTPEGDIISQTLWNTTEVYFKHHAEWKIVHAHFSYTRQKAPQLVEIPLPVHTAEVKFDGVLAELMTLEQAAMERWRKGDPWGYIELYMPDMTYFDPGAPQRVNGREAVCEIYKGLEGQINYEVMDFIEPRVLLSGDLAVLSYRFLSTKLHPDGSVRNRTPWNCTEVYQRIDGHWMIIHNHWSLINGEPA